MPAQAKIPEREIQKSIITALTYARIWHRRLEGGAKLIHSAGKMSFAKSSMTGMPDVLACHHGQLIAIEVKAAGGRLSPEQKRTLQEIVASGGRAAVAYSAQDVVAWAKGEKMGFEQDENFITILR